MKIVSTSYVSTPEFSDPVTWLTRISFYTGILEELAKGHEVASIESINYEGRHESNGVRYFFLKHGKRNIRFPLRIHRLVKNLQPHVVFINGFIFPLQIIQLRLKLGNAVKIIILHRAEKPFNGIKKYLQMIADRCVNAYLFSSIEFKNEWVNRGNIRDQSKIHEVMQASSRFYAENADFAKSSKGIDASRVFLWVGRLDMNKDPLTVIDAFIAFLQREPLARLYMIYQTNELLQTVLEKVNKDFKAATAIRLVGKVPYSDLQKWYNSADFIISGSHYEGSGIGVCEAMSCGCIPVLTNIASFRAMTGHGKCGFLYSAGNKEELLAVLLQTKEMNITKEKEKVVAHFDEALSFKAIAGKINRVIEQTGV